jgi:DNA-binding protein H-NS
LKPKPQPLPVKYADPADPSHTWSGKGRVPGWLQANLDAGAALNKFLVNKKQLT